ncbi:hypothetical protein N7534_010191 [Penicillium rubens]|nr:hypothetical protein N7534_010191 [Penicillium rubens]
MACPQLRFRLDRPGKRWTSDKTGQHTGSSPAAGVKSGFKPQDCLPQEACRVKSHLSSGCGFSP